MVVRNDGTAALSEVASLFCQRECRPERWRRSASGAGLRSSTVILKLLSLGSAANAGSKGATHGRRLDPRRSRPALNSSSPGEALPGRGTAAYPVRKTPEGTG